MKSSVVHIDTPVNADSSGQLQITGIGIDLVGTRLHLMAQLTAPDFIINTLEVTKEGRPIRHLIEQIYGDEVLGTAQRRAKGIMLTTGGINLLTVPHKSNEPGLILKLTNQFYSAVDAFTKQYGLIPAKIKDSDSLKLLATKYLPHFFEEHVRKPFGRLP